MPIRNGVLIAVLAGLLTACAGVRHRHPVIRIVGSDTMLPLNRVLAAAYEQHMPERSVQCSGGGTAVGMQALIAGKADICAASRPIAPEEVRAVAAKYHSIGMAHFVCRDAVEIFLHPQNPVSSLSLAQGKAIFSGKITNWRQVGGEDRLIRVYTRAPSSGTHRYVKEHLLQGVDYCADAREVASNEEMVRRISNDVSGIGYGGNAFLKSVKACRLEGIAPALEPVGTGTYPLSRYLYFYTVHETYGPVKEFIDWVISREVQPLIEQSGYFPIWSP